MGLVKHQIRNQFRTNEVDIGEAEVCNIARMSIEIGAADFSDIYSPHRITTRASEFGLRPGFAVDLLEEKPSGGPWDLSRPEDTEEAASEKPTSSPFDANFKKKLAKCIIQQKRVPEPEPVPVVLYVVYNNFRRLRL